MSTSIVDYECTTALWRGTGPDGKIRENSPDEDIGLAEDEIAFCDVAVLALGDVALKKIARELVAVQRENATIDWTLKDPVGADLLAKYGHPRDAEARANGTVCD